MVCANARAGTRTLRTRLSPRQLDPRRHGHSACSEGPRRHGHSACSVVLLPSQAGSAPQLCPRDTSLATEHHPSPFVPHIRFLSRFTSTVSCHHFVPLHLSCSFLTATFSNSYLHTHLSRSLATSAERPSFSDPRPSNHPNATSPRNRQSQTQNLTPGDLTHQQFIQVSLSQTTFVFSLPAFEAPSATASRTLVQPACSLGFRPEAHLQ